MEEIIENTLNATFVDRHRSHIWQPITDKDLWDPPRGSQRVPEEELKSEFNREVARTIIPSFPVELQLKFVLWDPLGPPRGVPRGVPEGPRWSQRDPEEELRSVFNGKVARNNGLKNDFF